MAHISILGTGNMGQAIAAAEIAAELPNSRVLKAFRTGGFGLVA